MAAEAQYRGSVHTKELACCHAVLRLILDHLILDNDLKSQCAIFDLDHFFNSDL